jgi:Bacteriophage CI repressor helix-turn-helix domain
MIRDRRDGVRVRQADLADRVREVREDLYGEHGAQFLADALGLPVRTWLNYEQGVMIPAEFILKLIDATGVSSHWLLTGQGPKYPARGPSSP